MNMADFLFAQPSAISGAARSFDLWGQYDHYNVSRSGRQADARALYNDWRAVGQMLFEEFESDKAKAERERVTGVKK